MTIKEKRKPKRYKIFPNTYVVGARNKKERNYSDGDIITSRAVHMLEFHIELNSSVWINETTNSVTEKEKGPLYSGNSVKKFDRLYRETESLDFIIED